MSLGGGGFNQLENAAYNRIFEDENVLLVAAAGNDGNTAFSYPASYDSVMSVAAVDRFENHASFSQWNNQVDIAAPGVDVLSTLPGNTYVLLLNIFNLQMIVYQFHFFNLSSLYMIPTDTAHTVVLRWPRHMLAASQL